MWSNDEETEAGIEVAGEQNFRAITCNHTKMRVERIVDYSALGRGQNWSAILDSRISERCNGQVHFRPTSRVAARTHTQLLLN